MGRWCAEYIEIRRREIGPATLASHGRTLDLLCEFFGGDRDLSSISRREAQQWRLWLTQRYAEPTVCKHVRAAKVVWKTAVDWEATNLPSPFAGVRSTAPIIDPTARRPLSVAEGEAMIAAAGPRWRAIVAVLFYSGLRRSESLSLRWDDVDFDAGRITVRHEGAQTTKRRRRIVRLEPRLAEILQSCERTGERVVGPRGDHRTGLSHVVRTIGERAGIHGVTPQVLRQSRSTLWFSAYPHHVAAAWMGHSPEVARRHYLGVPDEYYSAGPVPSPRGEGTMSSDLTHSGPERTVTRFSDHASGPRSFPW